MTVITLSPVDSRRLEFLLSVLVPRAIPETRGRCQTCGRRWSGDMAEHLLTPAHGAVGAAKSAQRAGLREAKFWSQVDRLGAVPDFAPHLGRCWVWQGPQIIVASRDAYGSSPRVRGERYAHRVSYALANGPIPARLHLDHLCRVTLCVNPAHLEPVTCKENVRRGKNGVLLHLRAPNRHRFRSASGAARDPRTHCFHGHEITPASTLPNGDCRTCNREAVRRYNDRKARAVA